MSYAIAFAWNDKCEKELKQKGFKKREVYIRHEDDLPKDNGLRQFMDMENTPYQFAVTGYWGGEVD